MSEKQKRKYTNKLESRLSIQKLSFWLVLFKKKIWKKEMAFFQGTMI